MAPASEPSRTEGSLLDPFLTPDDARRRLRSWESEGRLSAVAAPSMLHALRGEGGGIRLVGAVGFPSGAHTLTSKRVELLEVARLEAWGAEVALTPHLLLAGPMGELEEEMAALLKTAPELEVRFAVEWPRLPRAARTRFLRLLKEHPPEVLRVSFGLYGPPPGTAETTALRSQVPAKVRVKVPARDSAEASALLASGADLVEVAEPAGERGSP